MKTKYIRIAERATLAANAALSAGAQEKAGFLAYHAFESSGGALGTHLGYSMGKAVSHNLKLKRFQEAAKKAKPVILEPIMKIEVVVPDKFMGDITGNLSGKRGQIDGMDERGDLKVIRAQVPLSEMFGYVTALRSMTEGRGSSTMEFDHYAIVPPNVAQTIVESRK